jgi:hypothetical protein
LNKEGSLAMTLLFYAKNDDMYCTILFTNNKSNVMQRFDFIKEFKVILIQCGVEEQKVFKTFNEYPNSLQLSELLEEYIEQNDGAHIGNIKLRVELEQTPYYK